LSAHGREENASTLVHFGADADGRRGSPSVRAALRRRAAWPGQIWSRGGGRFSSAALLSRGSGSGSRRQLCLRVLHQLRKVFRGEDAALDEQANEQTHANPKFIVLVLKLPNESGIAPRCFFMRRSQAADRHVLRVVPEEIKHVRVGCCSCRSTERPDTRSVADPARFIRLFDKLPIVLPAPVCAGNRCWRNHAEPSKPRRRAAGGSCSPRAGWTSMSCANGNTLTQTAVRIWQRNSANTSPRIFPTGSHDPFQAAFARLLKDLRSEKATAQNAE
jgi:hypothetical protein